MTSILMLSNCIFNRGIYVKKHEILDELKSIRESKRSLLDKLQENSLDYGNCQREIWKLDEVIWLIESGSQDEEFEK